MWDDQAAAGAATPETKGKTLNSADLSKHTRLRNC